MARPHPELVELAAGRALRRGVCNDALVASAIEHRMTGLLWTWAQERSAGGAGLATLTRADLANRAHHRRLWHTLREVQRRLSELGIEMATAKGVTAELRWYTRLGERPCTDLDVLIAPDDVARAPQVVEALHPDHPLGKDIGDLARRGRMQSVNLVVDGVPVDFHFDLLKVGIATRQRELVWDRMQRCACPDGGSVLVPAPEVALVHALLHLNKDRFWYLLGFADVARILGNGDLDWGFVDRFLRAEGLEVAGYRSLETVTRVLDIACPAHRRLRGPRAALWSAAWHERTALLGREEAIRHHRRHDWIPFVARGRLGEALRWWVHAVLPPAATVDAHYAGLSGPYLWKLARGRLRAFRRRRREQRTGRPDETAVCDEPPAWVLTKAALLARRAAEAPLWVPVRGSSMGRSIRPGCEVRVVPADRPRRFEIWGYCDQRGALVVHRYRHRKRGVHRLQADVRLRPDPAVRSEQLVGRVTAVRRDGRTRRLGLRDRLTGALARSGRAAKARLARAAPRPELR